VDVVVQTKKLMADWAGYRAANPTTNSLIDPNQSSLAIRRSRIKKILVSLPSWEDFENACRAVYGIS
jgi:hypothetical protein